MDNQQGTIFGTMIRPKRSSDDERSNPNPNVSRLKIRKQQFNEVTEQMCLVRSACHFDRCLVACEWVMVMRPKTCQNPEARRLMTRYFVRSISMGVCRSANEQVREIEDVRPSETGSAEYMVGGKWVGEVADKMIKKKFQQEHVLRVRHSNGKYFDVEWKNRANEVIKTVEEGSNISAFEGFYPMLDVIAAQREDSNSWNVYAAKSTLANGGFGLFYGGLSLTGKKQAMTDYSGHKLKYQLWPDAFCHVLGLDPPGTHVIRFGPERIDGRYKDVEELRGHGAGQLANSAKDTEFEANCCYDTVSSMFNVTVRTTRPVEPGEELFCYYIHDLEELKIIRDTATVRELPWPARLNLIEFKRAEQNGTVEAFQEAVDAFLKKDAKSSSTGRHTRSGDGETMYAADCRVPHVSGTTLERIFKNHGGDEVFREYRSKMIVLVAKSIKDPVRPGVFAMTKIEEGSEIGFVPNLNENLERFPGTLLVEDLAVKGSESNARVSDDGIVVATRSIGSREEIVLEDCYHEYSKLGDSKRTPKRSPDEIESDAHDSKRPKKAE